MHQGISSTTLNRYESAVDAYINPSIIEERKLNVAQMDVFSRLMMARTIHQQVILREAGLSERPASHQVLLEDVETFKWDGRKGKIGF